MEIVSAVASVGSLIGGVTAVATHLNNIKERYQNAPLNVTLIASSLVTVKRALEAIDRWRSSTRDSSETSEQLDKDLTMSLEACACLISFIDRKLKDMDLLNPSRYERARFVALDAIFKDFTSNLDTQIRGLQLLIQVYDCQTMAERTERLRRTDTRRVLREIEENTVSLNLEDQDLADAVSILSDEPSVNLEVDHILLNSPLYRKVYGDRYLKRVNRQSGVPIVSPRNSMQESAREPAHGHRRSRIQVADPPFITYGSIPFLGIPFQGEHVQDESSGSEPEIEDPEVQRDSNTVTGQELTTDSNGSSLKETPAETNFGGERPSESGERAANLEGKEESSVLKDSSSVKLTQSEEKSQSIANQFSGLVSQDTVQVVASAPTGALDIKSESNLEEEARSGVTDERHDILAQNSRNEIEDLQKEPSYQPEVDEGRGIPLDNSQLMFSMGSSNSTQLQAATENQSIIVCSNGQEKPQTPTIVEPHNSPKLSTKDASSEAEKDGSNAFNIDFGEDLNLDISAPPSDRMLKDSTITSSARSLLAGPAIVGTPVSDSPTFPTTGTPALSTPSSSIADPSSRRGSIQDSVEVPITDAYTTTVPTPATYQSSVTANSSRRESAQGPPDSSPVDGPFSATAVIPNANIVLALRDQIYANRNTSPVSIRSDPKSDQEPLASPEAPLAGASSVQRKPTLHSQRPSSEVLPSASLKDGLNDNESSSDKAVSRDDGPSPVLQISPPPVSPKSPDKGNRRSHSSASSPKAPVSVFSNRLSYQPAYSPQIHLQSITNVPPPIPKRTPPPVPQKVEQESTSAFHGQDASSYDKWSSESLSVRSVSNPMTPSQSDQIQDPGNTVEARREAEGSSPVLSVNSPTGSIARASKSPSNSPPIPSSYSPSRPMTATFPLSSSSVPPPLPPRPSTSSLSRAIDPAQNDNGLNRASSKIVTHRRSDTAPSPSANSFTVETASSTNSESKTTPETASMETSSTIATAGCSNERPSFDDQTNVTSTLTVPSANTIGLSPQMSSNHILYALNHHLGAGADVSAIDNSPKKQSLHHRVSGFFKTKDKANQIKLLHEAAHEGNIPLLESCLRNCSTRDLHSAIMMFNEDVPKTPLMRAAAAGHVGCIELIVKTGSDFKTADKRGRIALHYAIVNGRPEAVQWLVQRFRIVATNPNIALPSGPLEITDGESMGSLALATSTGNVEIMEVLIRNGARLEATDPEHHQTPLFTAISCHKLAAMKLLVHHHANVHHRNKYKETPLIFATKAGMTDIVAYLRENGANLSAQDVNGDYAVHHACRLGHLDIVELLYLTIQDLEVRNSIGERPIHVAAASNNHLVLKALLRIGCNANAWTDPPPKGAAKKSAILASAPLHYACRNGNYDAANDLVEYGALVNSALEDGTSPLMLACEAKDLATANLLLGNGANVNAQKESDHNTPLHIAVAKGELDIVKQLLDYGAESSKRNKKGELPLTHAANLGAAKGEIVAYMAKHQKLVKHMHGPNNSLFNPVQPQVSSAPSTMPQPTISGQNFYAPAYLPAPSAPSTMHYHSNAGLNFPYTAGYLPAPAIIPNIPNLSNIPYMGTTSDAGRLDPLTGYFNPADDMAPTSAPPAYHTLPPRQRPTGG